MEFLSHCLPSTLIVDYFMPEKNGLEFLEQLARHCDFGTSAVYLCSAITPTQEQIEQLEELGTNILDKSVICDRHALLELLGSGVRVTGKE